MAAGFVESIFQSILAIVHFCGLAEHITHIACRRSWIYDFYTGTIAHEDGVHLEVYHHLNLEDTAAVLVLLDQFLRRMNGFGLDVLALFGTGPELYLAWSGLYVFAHANDIVEEVLCVEVGILSVWYVQWFYAYNSVKCQVVEQEICDLASKQKPVSRSRFRVLPNQKHLATNCAWWKLADGCTLHGRGIDAHSAPPRCRVFSIEKQKHQEQK